MSTSITCDTKGRTPDPNSLDHTSDISEEEHGKFVKAFRIFKEQTDFENEVSPIMLKYYVQMAYLEGWKSSNK
jgi:hypothetical protein